MKIPRKFNQYLMVSGKVFKNDFILRLMYPLKRVSERCRGLKLMINFGISEKLYGSSNIWNS